MKNNKGITLVELIVSFTLVAVTTIYFFQCITVVKEMYSNSKAEVDEYTNFYYAFKILETKFYDASDKDSLDGFNSEKYGFSWRNKPKGDNIYQYEITIDDKKKDIYLFYKENNSDTEEDTQ